MVVQLKVFLFNTFNDNWNFDGCGMIIQILMCKYMICWATSQKSNHLNLTDVSKNCVDLKCIVSVLLIKLSIRVGQKPKLKKNLGFGFFWDNNLFEKKRPYQKKHN